MSTRKPIRLTPRGELVFGSLAGLVAVFTIVIFFAALGDYLGI